MQKLISVIVPSYNRGHLLSQALDSLLGQKVNLECLVIDDGSTDNTREVVLEYTRKYPFIKYYSRPSELVKGANACRNYGLKLSNGTYIKWLDSDDFLAEDCLKKQLLSIEESNSNVDFCTAQFFTLTNTKDIQYVNKFWCHQLFTDNISRDLILGSLRWQTACGLWKKAFMEEKPFNENLQNSQEWLFHIEQSFKRQIIYSYTNQPLIFVRQQSGSMSHSSNKKGTYYYSAALARLFAYELIAEKIGYSKEKIHLLKKYTRFTFYSLYKGSITTFLKLFILYFKWFQFFLKSKKENR